MIRLDRSASSVLVHCSCGWRALGSNDAQARRAGADHEASCHPTNHRFRHASAKAARRARQDAA